MFPLRSLTLSLVLTALFGLFSLPSEVNATALTYSLLANEKSCFYIWNDKPGKKVGFYFAVAYKRHITEQEHSYFSLSIRFKKVDLLILTTLSEDLMTILS